MLKFYIVFFELSLACASFAVFPKYSLICVAIDHVFLKVFFKFLLLADITVFYFFTSIIEILTVRSIIGPYDSYLIFLFLALSIAFCFCLFILVVSNYFSGIEILSCPTYKGKWNLLPNQPQLQGRNKTLTWKGVVNSVPF